MLVRVRMASTCNLGGERRRGDHYLVTADEARVLAGAGALEPDIELAGGLTGDADELAHALEQLRAELFPDHQPEASA